MVNPYVDSLIWFLVTSLATLLFLWVFEKVTKYDDWEEVKRGNVAAAMSIGGKIFGIANVFRFSIFHNDTVWYSLIWGVFGFVVLLLAYFLFEFMTPKFKVDEEIAKDNRAVGLLSMMISISLSFVVGASIS